MSIYLLVENDLKKGHVLKVISEEEDVKIIAKSLLENNDDGKRILEILVGDLFFKYMRSHKKCYEKHSTRNILKTFSKLNFYFSELSLNWLVLDKYVNKELFKEISGRE